MTCNCIVNEHGVVTTMCGAHANTFRRTHECDVAFQLEKQREGFEKQLHTREVIIDSLVAQIEALKKRG